MARLLLITLHDPFALGVRQLAAYIKAHGHQVHMCFVGTSEATAGSEFLTSEQVNSLPDEDRSGFLRFFDGRLNQGASAQQPLSAETLDAVLNCANTFSPDIIGVSCRAWVFALIPPLFKKLKNALPKSLYVAGGMGPTEDSNFFLQMGFDLVIMGEGEQSLLDICVQSDGPKNYHSIPNAVFLSGSKTNYNPLYPLISDLGKLPLPLWAGKECSFIEDEKIISGEHWKGMDSYNCLTGRGCPGNCSYCSTGLQQTIYRESGHKPHRYRTRPMQSVFEELGIAKDKGAQFIRIADEYFIRPIPELIHFFTRYNEEIGLRYMAYLSASQLCRSEELFSLATKHLASYYLGVQTGSEPFNREMYNRYGSNDDTINIAHKMYARHIPAYIFLIGGMPLKTEGDYAKDYDLIKKLPPFNPRLFPFVFPSITRYYPNASSPLVENHPFLREYHEKPKKFLYESLLYYARQLYAEDDDAFEEIRTREDFKRNPALLYSFYHTQTRNAHLRYITEQARRLAGKEVFFWGMGDVFQRCKHLFAKSIPTAMLLGRRWLTSVQPSHADGLPLHATEDVFAQKELPPVVLFAKKEYARIMAQRLYALHPELGNNMVICALPPGGTEL